MTATLTQQKRTSRKGVGPDDPVTAYARDVTEGRVLAGPWVRLACQRHLDDLERPDLVWKVEEVTRAIGFFRDVLRLNGGVFEGEPFLLQPWQSFIVGSLFGWYGPDGFRRFRVAYVEVAKGNGKSPLAAGIGHYMLSADNEPRAEVYAAATKKDQAMILFRDAVAMRDQSPALRKRLKSSGQLPNVWNLADLKTGSFYRPIASDDGQSGPRPHCGLIDELHEHKSSLVVDMMRAGTKGRRQALIFEITNSGYDRNTICRQHHEHSIKVLQGVFQNDSWFAYVASLDEGDEWTDEKVWPKANPNLGVSVTLKYLREQVREAIGMPAKQNSVRRLNLCEWTEQDERSIPMHDWDRGAAPIDLDSLKGRSCYGGLDLAKTSDLSALSLVFPPQSENEPWKVVVWFWVPKADITKRSERDQVPYDVWAREGFLETTPGNTTDYRWIEAAILGWHYLNPRARDEKSTPQHCLWCDGPFKSNERCPKNTGLAGWFDILEIAYDRMFAGPVVQTLGDEGLKLVEFGQGFVSMAAPTFELHRLIYAGQLQHGGDPILRWNASNLTVATDPAGNIKPDKERSTERIDGIVATIMALGRAIQAPTDGSWRPM